MRTVGALPLLLIVVLSACTSTGSPTATPTTVKPTSTAAPETTTTKPTTTTEPRTTTTQAATTSDPHTTASATLPAEWTVKIDGDLLVHLAAGLGSVWVTGSLDGVPYLYGVDPDTAVVEASWALASSPTRAGTLNVAVGDRYVWVVLEASVLRVNPDDGSWDSIGFGGGDASQGWLEHPWDVAVGDGAAWVVVEENVDGDILTHLYKVDADFSSGTEAVVGHTELLGTTISDLLVAEGRVWILPFGGANTCELVAVDPTTVTIETRIDLTGGCATPHGSLTAGDGYIYVTDRWSESVRRFDPTTDTEIDTRPTASNGLAAYSAGTAWLGGHGAPGPVIYGYTGTEMILEHFNPLDRHMSDLAATPTTLWVIVDEPSALLRLMPESL